MIQPLTIESANLGMADTLILLVLALVVFGPRKLPMIGRQIGKLMYELRKASNDFRFQMEEELRGNEDADKRWKEETQQPQDAPSFEELAKPVLLPEEEIAASGNEAPPQPEIHTPGVGEQAAATPEISTPSEPAAAEPLAAETLEAPVETSHSEATAATEIHHG